MSKKEQPCKDCKDRYVGCHADCERYARQKAELRRVKEARDKYIRERYG